MSKSVSGALVLPKKCLDREVWDIRILNLRQRGCIIRVLTVRKRLYEQARTQGRHERHFEELSRSDQAIEFEDVLEGDERGGVLE